MKGKYYESGSHRFIGEVIFEHCSWWVKGVKQYKEYKQLKEMHDIKILGSIHTNPELLEQS